MWFQDFGNSLLSELQLPNKPLPRQKPTAETFSDTPLPGRGCGDAARCFLNQRTPRKEDPLFYQETEAISNIIHDRFIAAYLCNGYVM